MAAVEKGILPLNKLQTNIISPNLWQQAETFDESTEGFRMPSNLAKSFDQFNLMF